METKRNKLWRKRHQWRLFKSKMMLFASYPQHKIVDNDGYYIEHPHWFELAKQRWNYHYKTMRTPCSCWLCRGEKYDRKAYKHETKRIISESME